MTDARPLVLSLLIIFAFGSIIPAVASPFIDDGDYNHDSILAGWVDAVLNGVKVYDTDEDITCTGWQRIVSACFIKKAIVGVMSAFSLDSLRIDIFGIAGETPRAFIYDNLVAFSFIPDVIATPILIFIMVSIIYSVVKLLPTT